MKGLGSYHGFPIRGCKIMEGNEKVLRWNVHYRLQHVLMFTSFIVLVLTGIPLKYAGVGVSRVFMNLWGGPEMASTVHRIAAVVMIISCVYHLAYLGWRMWKRIFSPDMIPSLKDLRDLYDNIRFYLGLAPRPPLFGRFTYWEKFDYWAVFWGIFIMVGSGLVLWFPVETVRFLPVWFLGIAKVAHSDEALLAGLAIFIWHFYNVHLRPEIFPMNWVWITGTITRKELKENYPLEYERLRLQEALGSHRVSKVHPPEPEAVASAKRTGIESDPEQGI